MPVYPETSSHLNNFTRADGTTALHSDDHARIVDLVVNAKHYLKGDGTTETQGNIDAFAAACVGKEGFFPPGTYVWPDGGTLTKASNTTYRGAGSRSSIITAKNAYAISGTNCNAGLISKMGMTMRAGSTTGGGIKLDSASREDIRDVEVIGANCTDPGIYLKGTVGCSIRRSQVQQIGTHAIRLDSSGGTLGFCNANIVEDCRVSFGVQGSTNAAIYSEGGGNTFRNNTLESGHQYGYWLNATAGDKIQNTWFEGQYTNILLTNCVSIQIIENKFHNDGTVAYHIDTTESNVNHRSNLLIQGNLFQDPANSGINIRLGTNVSYCTILSNRGSHLVSGLIQDNGFGNLIWNGDNGDAIQVNGKFRPVLWLEADRTPAASGGDPDGAESIFSTVNAADQTNYFMVGSRGYPLFVTGADLTSSDELQERSFAFYVGTDGLLHARIRKGGYYTHQVGFSKQPNAYTVTNPSTDRGLNVTADTVAQVAAVLGTLLADLQAAGILP